jgi:hypothetical protein
MTFMIASGSPAAWRSRPEVVRIRQHDIDRKLGLMGLPAATG